MERISRRAFLGKAFRATVGAGLVYHGIRLTQDDDVPNYLCDVTQGIYDSAPPEVQRTYDQTTQSVLGKDFVQTYCDIAPKAEITTGITFGTGIGIFRLMGFLGHSVSRYLRTNEDAV